MKKMRIIRHRNRGWITIRERTYFKSFAAWDSYIKHPETLKGWEERILKTLGVIKQNDHKKPYRRYKFLQICPLPDEKYI
jgi:hypothetical protein